MPTRDELLAKLHKLPFCMRLTVLPNEGSIEVNVVSSKGTSCVWVSMDDFKAPVFCLTDISKEVISLIKKRILTKSLHINDFKGTKLENIITEEYNEKDLTELFGDFIKLPDEKAETVFCYRNSETGRFYFSKSIVGMSEILNEQYAVDTLWEDLKDDELKACLDEYEDIGCEMPFTEI